MKKIFLIAMTCVIGLALALPAWAIENEFGGYWRTRAFSQTDFSGTDSGTLSTVDTRTRLYYTAKFSDKFKFVNKFEFDPIWGDDTTGDIGADGKIFEIKNSYIDFDVNTLNLKVGVQPAVIARGFLIDDDFSGVTATLDLGTMTLPIIWAKVSDSDLDVDTDPNGNTNSDLGTSRDYLALNPVFNLDENTSVNPYLLIDKEQGTDTMVYYLGADVDAKLDAISVWGTLIYGGGKVNDVDASGFLVAGGADAGLVHGQLMYATGQDPNESDITAFVGPSGTCYYWSEILGYGLFGDTTFAGDTPPNSPNTTISNLMALNVGATIKPMDKLTLKADLWYASLVEDAANGETDLGVEVDLMATYAIMDNLKIDVVAAYLMAGDAVGDEDPIEVGTRLSLSF